VVEHRLAKARVAGSSPVSRSNLRSLCSFPWQSRVGIRAVLARLIRLVVGFKRGAVPKW
jgi:hypothetical protein